MQANLLSRPTEHETSPARAGVPRARMGLTARQDLALTAMLLLQGALLFVVTPLAGLGLGVVRLLITLLVLAIALLVVLVARGRTAAFVAWCRAGSIALGAVLVVAAPIWSSVLAIHFVNIVGLVLCSYVIARALFAPGPITLHRIIGAVVLYLMIALAFAMSYRLICDIIPNGLQGTAAGGELELFSSIVYFSLVTLTSTGYGDILPIHPVVRSLANLESIIGQIFPVTLIAALVAQHLEWRHHRGRPLDREPN